VTVRRYYLTKARSVGWLQIPENACLPTQMGMSSVENVSSGICFRYIKKQKDFVAEMNT